MTIKAITTLYKGFRFRSRLEARYAVFFDTLEIRWEYEKEGFDLTRVPFNCGIPGVYIDAGWYLPDFWLPDLDCWAEIKPDEDGSYVGIEKYWALAHGSGKNVCVFYGPVFHGPMTGFIDVYYGGGNPPGDDPSNVFIHDITDKWSPEERLEDYLQFPMMRPNQDLNASMREASRRIQEAIHAARSARFEKGEQR